MSDQWSSSPGSRPPAGRSAPPGWATGPTAVYEPPTFGSGPPLPPLPPPQDRSRDRLLAVVAAVLVVLVLAALGGVVFLSRPADVVATATTTTTNGRRATTTTAAPGAPSTTPGASTPSASGPTTSAAPTTTIDPALLPSQAEVEAMVRELSAFVESTRGLAFKTPVKVQMVSSDDFNARLEKDLEESKAEIQKQELALKPLGLTDPKIPLLESYRKLLQAGVLGFYDPKTKDLVIRGQQITPYTKQTVAHELVHALDDQWFGLDRPQYDEQKDEVSFAFSAVVEGDARRIENIYVGRMTPEEKSQRDDEEAAGMADADLNGVPEVLLKLIQAPYDFGQLFVRKLMDRGGNDTLAKAITDPPRMSASVMHPDRYFSGDVRAEVAKPKADGKETSDGVFGELMTRATLEAALATNEAAKAADGWAGDWYVTWVDDKKAPCIRIDYKMLTDQDLTDLKAAYTKWGQGRAGVKVESVGQDLLEVTSCTSGGASGGRSPA